MTIILTCAFCKRQETHTEPWSFPGWYKVMAQDGSLQGVFVCSETCGASWLMRRQLDREKRGVMQ